MNRDWRPKAAKLAESSKLNADVLVDLSKMILRSCTIINDRATKYTPEEARSKHLRLASLRDQLDQVVPIVNRISRVARSINNE